MMSAAIKIRKGLDIKLVGEAEKNINTVSPRTFACKPIDFTGIFPRVLVQVGDKLQAGAPVYTDKHRDNIIFSSPVSGTVKEIRRGLKRVLEEIVIEADSSISYVDFGTADPKDLTREEIVEKMLKSGVWPVIRQRPFSTVANPANEPKAIFISAFDTSPLAPDYNFMIEGQAGAFQAGIDALCKLTTGKVHLNVPAGPSVSAVYTGAAGVRLNRFAGPHPTGNIGPQVNRLDPICKGDVVWYLRPQEVLMIGRLFLTGKYDATKIYALTGSMINRPAYYKSISGAGIHEMVQGNEQEGAKRYISGNVLTGSGISSDGHTGFFDSQVTVIPEGDYSEFLGWAMPGFNKYSFYSQFFSRLRPKKKFIIDTNLHGGERALVVTGKYEKVFPFDIYPMQLIKAMLAEDIELMENLGIYEVDAEDFALIEFIDTSKMEIQAVVKQALELVRRETM